jgi:hypothetical protein
MTHLFKLRPGVTSVSVDGIEYTPEADGFVHVENLTTAVENFLTVDGHRAATEADFEGPAKGSEDDEKTALIARIDASGVKVDKRRSLANLRAIAAELAPETSPAAQIGDLTVNNANPSESQAT